MQIILTQNEIKNAVESYLKGMLTLSEDKVFNMEFQTTRNPSGCTATVTIENKMEDSEILVSPDPSPVLNTEEEEKEEKLTWETKSGMLVSPDPEPAPTPKKSFFENL